MSDNNNNNNNNNEATVKVKSDDPAKDPHDDYQKADKNKDFKPPSDEKVVEISEEDLKLKENLELLVQRVQDVDATIQANALTAIRSEIKSATSSMTSVPKPLKFLRPHFTTLKQYYSTMIDSDNKVALADILSVMAMTMAPEGSRESLTYKLQGAKQDIALWGHEYVRNLTGEVVEEFNSLADDEKSVDHLLPLIDQVVEFFMTHNAESDACDLLMEVDRLENIIPLVAEDSHDRVALYLIRCAAYAGDQEDMEKQLNIAYQIYVRCKNYLNALRVAMRLDNVDYVNEVMALCDDSEKKKQMAIAIGSQRFPYVDETGDDQIAALLGNAALNEHFHFLARELNVTNAKSPEDIYKTHLESGSRRRNAPPAANGAAQSVDSAKQNLASSFVNGFVNAAFGKDLLLTVDDGSDWLFKNKDHGIISATASLGLIKLWDLDNGFTDIDKYIHSKNAYIQAGAVLATGLISCGVTSEMDAAVALLSEYLENPNKDVKLSAIVGLGLSYAGAYREDVLSLLNPLVVDTSLSMELSAFSALSLSLVYVGSCNDDVCGNIIQAFMDRSATDLDDSAAKFLCLALGLLFLGKGEMCEAVLETLQVVEHPVMKFCSIVVQTCAYAGTGNVLQIQKLLAVCGEHIEDETKNGHQSAAALGLSAIAMGEDLGAEMSLRLIDNLLQYAEVNVRRAVPLAYALLSISNPRVTVVDTLSKLSHDVDQEVSQNAILSLGLIGAGTNHSRIAGLLRQLAVFYEKEPNHLFLVRIAQGLLHMGKGLLTLDPCHSDGLLRHKPSLAGLLILFFSSLDLKHNLLASRHWILFYLAASMRPRMLTTIDVDTLKPVPVSVRVGTAIDTVGQAGKPKTITGFQTHTTPVLLSHGDRAELATDEFISISSVLEGVVMVKKNPDAKKAAV